VPSFIFYRATPSRCSTEKAKLRITQTTPHDSPGNSDAEDLGKTQMGSPSTETPNAGRGMLKLATFDRSLAVTRKRRPSQAEADLGMFSMFGRTGAPQKRGPHKRTGKFLQHSNMPEIIEIRVRKRFYVARWRHRKSSYSTPSVICVYIIMLCESLTKCR